MCCKGLSYYIYKREKDEYTIITHNILTCIGNIFEYSLNWLLLNIERFFLYKRWNDNENIGKNLIKNDYTQKTKNTHKQKCLRHFQLYFLCFCFYYFRTKTSFSYYFIKTQKNKWKTGSFLKTFNYWSYNNSQLNT